MLEEEIRIVPADAVAQRVELAISCAGVEQLLGHHEEARACSRRRWRASRTRRRAKPPGC